MSPDVQQPGTFAWYTSWGKYEPYQRIPYDFDKSDIFLSLLIFYIFFMIFLFNTQSVPVFLEFHRLSAVWLWKLRIILSWWIVTMKVIVRWTNLVSFTTVVNLKVHSPSYQRGDRTLYRDCTYGLLWTITWTCWEYVHVAWITSLEIYTEHTWPVICIPRNNMHVSYVSWILSRN